MNNKYLLVYYLFIYVAFFFSLDFCFYSLHFAQV